MSTDFEDLGAEYTLYRWHIADPIRFTKSLRFEIEHKGWISDDGTESGKVEGHVEREDDIASVVFWYQMGQPKRFTGKTVVYRGRTMLEAYQQWLGK